MGRAGSRRGGGDTGAETGVTQPPGVLRGTLGATRRRERHGAEAPLAPSEGVWSCRRLDFGFLVSGTLGEYISVILGHPVCADLLWQPQETNVGNIYMWFKCQNSIKCQY